MPDLRERFGELDGIPAPDLRTAIHTRVPSPPPPTSPWRRVAAAAIAVIVAGAGLVLGVRAFSGIGEKEGSRPAAPSLAAPHERAATVAIAALVEAARHNSTTVTHDYIDVLDVGEEWQVIFCSGYPSHVCGDGLGDSTLTVSPDGADLVVTAASGQFDQELIVGYREPAEPPSPEHVFGHFIAQEIPEGRVLSGWHYWTGPIPSDLGAVCRLEAIDDKGQVVFSNEFQQTAPDSEQGRDGNFLQEVPAESHATEVNVSCSPYLPVQTQPEGEHHVLDSGTFETGKYRGQPWRFVVWRAEEVDDTKVLATWKRNLGDEAYCWAFDFEPFNNTGLNGEQEVAGSCGRLSESDLPQAFGSRTYFPGEGDTPAVAWGKVAPDVAAVEFRLSETNLVVATPLDAPTELGIKSRFYVVLLPAEAKGDIVALDKEGTVLARRSLTRY